MPRGVAMLALAAVAATGCRQLFGIDDTVVAGDGPVDQDEDAAVDAAPLPDAPTAPWGAATVLALGSGAAMDDDPSATGDLLELYFNSDRNGNSEIYVARRFSVDDPWGAPEVVVELSTSSTETTPQIALDGLTIYFSSNRLTTSNDLFVAQRVSRTSPWQPPQRIDALSTAFEELPGCPTMDGSALLLSRAMGADYDMFYATPAGGMEALPGVNTPAPEIAGCLSPDQRSLYFEAGPIGGVPDTLYVADRNHLLDTFQPRPIIELDSVARESDPWVSPDGRHMFFVSDRSGQNQIYESTR